VQLPCLTRDLPGIGGTIRQRPDDFLVEEIPLYEPSGQGEHVYCEIQKTGLSTFAAVRQIASALGISPRDIGYAGLKDTHAITRQTLSITGVDEAAVSNLRLDGIAVLWCARHGNKLRLGHLKANRFVIRIRDVNPTDVVRLAPIVDVLTRVGMPNYFGQQRFGRRDDNDLLGAALIRGDCQGLLDLLLGNPDPARDDPDSLASRQAYARGDYREAMRRLPRRAHVERVALQKLIRGAGPASAVAAIDHDLKRLWISAAQSRAFNAVVAHRIDRLNRLMPGDLAWKHDNGAVFLVEDAAAEQPRCDRFEISPSGPLLGYRMTPATGRPGEIESRVFAEMGLSAEAFRTSAGLKVRGARRPLRVRPENVSLSAGVDEHGPHITAAFTLPPGAFATVLLRELMKTDPPPADGDL